MIKDTARVDWTYTGKTDLAFGTGATRSEMLLGTLGCLIGIALYGYFFIVHAFQWSLWQYIIAAVIAFDVCGGIIANSLNSGKRFYSSLAKPGESRTVHLLKNHLFFTALHVHPLIIAWLYGAGNYWLYGIFWYTALLLSILLIERTVLYLRRPIAMCCVLIAILINAYFIASPVGFVWFIPVLFIKVVYGHGVREEPYRPLVEV